MPERSYNPSPRMTEILDAAVRVTAAGGLRALTHRAVDREAGLPEGSTSSYLRTRMALLVALSEHVADQLHAQVRALMEPLASEDGVDEEQLTAGIVGLFVEWLDHPEVSLVRAELSLEAVRVPAINEAFSPWHDDLIAAATPIAARTGHPQPLRLATATVAAFEGILLSALGQPEDRRENYLREMVGLLVQSLIR
ncbi:TetR/AcrR family transcriptional regulator [Janibacter sp. G1551]|uniref:TetR/AcrR family transcriptional regulator n=1 Tax=Janibacter sp. G1551 TaxID=3420440 RepID=UPI003CFE0C98